MDVTAVVTAISGVGTSVAAIGAAVLIIFAGVKGYKWVRGAM